MSSELVVFEEASDDAERAIRYYLENAGTHVALRFAPEIEAAYRGLREDRLAGVNHPRVKFRLPIKRVVLDRFPFAVVFYVEGGRVHIVAIEALRRKPGYWTSRFGRR